MRIVIFFMCLAFASAEVEEFFKMWQTAMERLASHDVQQTTQRSPVATTKTAASNHNQIPLSRTLYTHPPWASYQENVAFVYARTQRHPHQHLIPLQHRRPHQQIRGNHQYDHPDHQYDQRNHQYDQPNHQYDLPNHLYDQPNHQYASNYLPYQQPGLHQQNHNRHEQVHGLHQQNHGLNQQDHGLHQQNHRQHQQDMGLHQQRPSLRQNYPTPAYDSSSPAVSQNDPSVQTQYGTPVKRPQSELTRAEQFVSDIERQLGFTMKGGNTFHHQNQYTSRSAAPTVTPQGPRLNTQPMTWYQQNLFVAYPSLSYNSIPQRSFRHSQYPTMFAPPGINPYQSPSIQQWNGPYMKEEEPEHYGNRYRWGPTNYYQPQTVHVYNQGYHRQQYVPMKQMNQNYGRVAPAVPAHQPTYTTSNIPVNTQRSSVYPSSPTYRSTYTQARRSGQQARATKPVIPTFETAFTRSSIPVPQSAGITAYMGQNQKRQQTMVRSNNAYSMNTPSWNTQSMNQRSELTQINSQNRWTSPPYTPQEAVQFNTQPFPKQTSNSLNNQRPALPEEIAKMTTKPISGQTPARTPTMDQLAYYRPHFLHRTILSG